MVDANFRCHVFSTDFHMHASNLNLKPISICSAILLVAFAFGGVANAGDAGHAWGTIENPGGAALNSAAMHEQGALSAGAVNGPTASNGGGFPAVTSCGVCTTITITGSNDSISGTSITGTNSGAVSSNGLFQ